MNRKKWAAAIFAAAALVLKTAGELDRNDAIYPVTDKAGDIVKLFASLFGLTF